MAKKKYSKYLGLVFLLLLCSVVSCSNQRALIVSTQEPSSLSAWKRKLIPVRSSRSPRSPSFLPPTPRRRPPPPPRRPPPPPRRSSPPPPPPPSLGRDL
ncbi:sulfated surface glycoprotein 185-like [Capsella rubella]|uniref:sulfated surface glycoprotein 185-like n=1 Tax=Capsella rubella TaxID=81985 RepID=UPI000CD510FA|nr:sulfated surface glycoprotein 185-like [Capsella rubella]